MARGRFVRTVYPVGVCLPRLDAPDPHVPDVAGTVADRVEVDTARRLGVRAIGEELQPDAPGETAEEREIDTVHEGPRAQGQGKPAPDVGRFTNCGQVFR